MLKAFIMFQLTTISWIFFRAQSLNQIKVIFASVLKFNWDFPQGASTLSEVMFFAAFPILVMAFQTIKEQRPSWFSEKSMLNYFQLPQLPLPTKSIVYGILTYLLCFYGAKAQAFIYFQF